MTLLAVAVEGRGVVDPEEPVLRADDEALLRGRAAFETIRVYGRERCSSSPSTSSGSRRRPTHRAAGGRTAQARRARTAGARRRRRPGRSAAPHLDADARRARTRQRTPRPLRRPARARAGTDLAPGNPGRGAVDAAGRQIDELRGEHGGGSRGGAPGRRRRPLRRRRRIVLEGPTTNVWWRRERILFTPSLELGILAGVTPATVIELAPRRVTTSRRALPLSDLQTADEAFTSSSVREVMPVTSLDDRPIAPGKARRRTASRSEKGYGATLAS